MNQLANRILTSITDFKNFLLNELVDDADEQMNDRLNMKMFYVVQSLNQNKTNNSR